MPKTLDQVKATSLRINFAEDKVTQVELVADIYAGQEYIATMYHAWVPGELPATLTGAEKAAFVSIMTKLLAEFRTKKEL